MGTVFLIKGVESIKKAPLIESLKYFQQMYMIRVKYIETERTALLKFKQVIINHIQSFKKYRANKDLIDSLELSIMEKNNFQEIIEFLK